MKKLLFFALICTVICAVSFELSAHDTDSKSAEIYTCKRCDGTGYEPNMTQACPHCNGGRVQHYYDCQKCWGKGTVTNKYGEQEKCRNCDGTGKIYVDEQCAYCNGTGSEKKKCMLCNGSGTVNK